MASLITKKSVPTKMVDRTTLKPSGKRIALIGLGGISQSVHLPIIRRLHDQVQLVAIVDLSDERTRQIGATLGSEVSRFKTVQDLIDAKKSGLKIDGAVLATAGTHSIDTANLLQAGIPVLSEKPLAYSLSEHYQLQQIPNINSQLRVGYMKEYDPASVAARELLRDVKIRSVEIEVLHPADQAQLQFANLRKPTNDVLQDDINKSMAPLHEAIKNALGNITDVDTRNLDRLYPNVILGSVIHDVALLRYLVGGIGTVTYAKHYGSQFPGSLLLSGDLQIHNAPWTLNWHFIDKYPHYKETITVHHETGTIELVFEVPYMLNVASQLNVVSRENELGVVEKTLSWPQLEAFEQEWLSFLSLIEGNPLPGSSLDESVEDIKVGQKIIHQLAISKGISLTEDAEALN